MKILSRAEPVFLCTFRAEPKDHECQEAIWSEGRACRACYVDCYRRGWSKRRVDADNRRRCQANDREPKSD